MNRRSFLRSLVSAPVAAVLPAAAVATTVAPMFHSGGYVGSRRASHGEVMALIERSEGLFTSSQQEKIVARLNAAKEAARVGSQEDVRKMVTIIRENFMVKPIA